MAVAFRSSSAVIYSGRVNTVLTAPAGIQDGDVLLAVVLIGAVGPPTPTPPTGFSVATGFPTTATIGGFSVKVWVYTKIAASESGNYTWTHASNSSQGYICAISGADTTTPLNPNATTNSGTGATTTATGLTTAQNNSLVIFISQDWGDTSNSLTAPTGTTPTFNTRLNPGTIGGILFVADGVLATAGATGNKTITNNTSGANAWQGFLVAVQPPAAAPGLAKISRFIRQAVNRASTY